MTLREYWTSCRAEWAEMHEPHRPLIRFDVFVALVAIAAATTILGVAVNRSGFVWAGVVLLVLVTIVASVGIGRSTGPIE